jgi:hypothetical protein
MKRVDEFLIPESLHQEYEQAKRQFLAKGYILTIKECPSELFKLPAREQLEACEVSGCTALQYMSDTYNVAEPANERIGGRMIPVEKESKRYSVIFIRSDYDPDVPAAQMIMSKFCILYHELGHAEDFYQGINYNHTKREFSVKKAEAYADDFAVRHLKRIKCEMLVEGKKRTTTLGDWYRQNRYRGVYID